MKRVEKILWQTVDTILLIAIAGMVAMITLQVGSRLLGGSIGWTEELSRMLFVWTIWMGMAAGFRNGQQPAIDLLVNATSGYTRLALRLLSVVCISIFFAVVAWYALQLTLQQIRFGEVSAILQIGKWTMSVPIVLGALLSIVGAILQVFEEFRQAKHPDAGTVNIENVSDLTSADDGKKDSNFSFVGKERCRPLEHSSSVMSAGKGGHA